VEWEIDEHLEYLLYLLSAFQSPEQDKINMVSHGVCGCLHWHCERHSVQERVEKQSNQSTLLHSQMYKFMS